MEEEEDMEWSYPVNQIGGAEMMPMPASIGYGFNQQQLDNIYRPQGIWSRRMS